MIPLANLRHRETTSSSPGKTGSAVLDRMFKLGRSTRGEYVEAAGQAKYLARFVLAAARELEDMRREQG